MWTAPEPVEQPKLAPVEEFDEVAYINYSNAQERFILDSGCRRSMAGKRWCDEARRRLAGIGLRPVEVPCDDRFRFGDGRVALASSSWKYPFGIYGRDGVLSIAEVPQECPPLLSAKFVGELEVIMDFKDKSLAIDGEKRPMPMLSSGHPALDVAEYDDKAEELVAATTAEEESPGGVMKRGVRRRFRRDVEAWMMTNERPQETFKAT